MNPSPLAHRANEFRTSNDLDSFIEEDSYLAGRQSSPLNIESLAEASELLGKAWLVAEKPGTLTPAQLRAFRLHYGKDKSSISGVAKAMSIRRDTAKDYLKQAIQRIKARIEAKASPIYITQARD